MNRIEYLVDCLMEEAAEVIVEASKCQRFTLDQKYLESNATNRKRLELEVKDMIIVARILQDEGIIDAYLPTQQEFDRKREKLIEKFMQLSRDYGALQDDDVDTVAIHTKAGALAERETMAVEFEIAGDHGIARRIRERGKCKHEGWTFATHGRNCPKCGAVIVEGL